MNPTQHKTNNRVLGAPLGWDQTQVSCGALAITDCVVEGHTSIASFWRPAADELEALNAGGLVVLNVFGTGMPAVSVGVCA